MPAAALVLAAWFGFLSVDGGGIASPSDAVAAAAGVCWLAVAAVAASPLLRYLRHRRRFRTAILAG
ncbi:hypothetical protein [Phycisphaera mikurensis]|uniref:hypothetical protein n=1 Tax=Phycisphaera mikurensis TaxID=547188 RepID=UPI0012B57A11|nr:hypothetical protein [Phycisphaera mikurensis]MBB6441430.1 hypothetical protein [Phycisphaera mikurensis]